MTAAPHLSVVEQVAIALCSWLNGKKRPGQSETIWATLTEEQKFAYREQAQAALDASGYDALKVENERLDGLLNSPEILDFNKALPLEAAHQRERWGTDHDTGKTPADWFWLIGYLAGKALHSLVSGNTEKALHHVITTAAALCNWHAAILGKTNMRPGIETPAGEDA